MVLCSEYSYSNINKPFLITCLPFQFIALVTHVLYFVHENQNKVPYQFPDHQKVESYKHSEDAATVRHKRSEGESFLFLPNKNAVAGEHGHQHLYNRNMGLYFFCNLQKQAKKRQKRILTSAMNFTLYSIKEHGMRHFVVLISHSLPYSVVYQVLLE